jgi:hypothetical protein
VGLSQVVREQLDFLEEISAEHVPEIADVENVRGRLALVVPTLSVRREDAVAEEVLGESGAQTALDEQVRITENRFDVSGVKRVDDRQRTDGRHVDGSPEDLAELVEVLPQRLETISVGF